MQCKIELTWCGLTEPGLYTVHVHAVSACIYSLPASLCHIYFLCFQWLPDTVDLLLQDHLTLEVHHTGTPFTPLK